MHTTSISYEVKNILTGEGPISSYMDEGASLVYNTLLVSW